MLTIKYGAEFKRDYKRVVKRNLDMRLLEQVIERLALEEKRERLLEMRDTEFNPGCQYCCGIGVDQDVKRYPAGEQVERT